MRTLLVATLLLLSHSPMLAQAGGEGDGPGAPQGLSAGDWSGLRAAWEAGRHAAHAVDAGHRARNPGQRWSTTFDGRGFRTTPDHGGWTWGLELTRYGWSDVAPVPGRPRSVSARGGEVAYDWDGRLTEWYRNDRRGLEHGFTLESRPAGARGDLTLELAIRGGLAAEIGPGGRDVRFVDAAGRAAVTYSGLVVFAADGRDLPARFVPDADGLRLTVDDAGARYPLTIDPIAQQAYLKASNTAGGDEFGWAVAIDGCTVVVGAPGEDSSATGVDGDESDDSLANAGAAYVFVRDGAVWSQQAYLKASNTDPSDRFGEAVAISGDTVVVGADTEDGSATGVDGASDNAATFAGAAYVFVRDGETWSQQAYLKASNTDAFDRFGNAVAVSGDTIVVGAFQEASNATGVNGDQDDDSLGVAGAAYVYVRSGTTWAQQAYLKSSSPDASDQFGWSVALDDDTIVVGARLEDGGATGVGGNDADDSALSAGAAYVFTRAGTTWSQQAYLKASNPDALDNFGLPVSVSGDVAVVGAWREASDATGIGGDESDDDAAFSGAAYVFTRDGTTWSQAAYLKASNSEAGDSFGLALSVSGDSVVVGATGEDSMATGAGGDPLDNTQSGSGAAYVFDLDLDAWTDLGQALAGTHGKPKLVGSGTLLTGDPVSLSLTHALGSTTTYFVIGIAEANLPFYGGTLVPWFEAPLGLFLALPTNASGELLLSDTWPGGVPGGTELTFQHWIVDPGGPFGFASSNAVRGTVP